MPRYRSRLHRCLMDESAEALTHAARAAGPHDARIAARVLSEPRLTSAWEARHAGLLLPVAEHRARIRQIRALRTVAVRLVHRQALIAHIRRHRLAGAARDRLLAAFHGPLEPRDAALAEHRRYLLAVASRIATDHLAHVIQDSPGAELLGQYEGAYAEYFDLYCFVAGCESEALVEAARPAMIDLEQRAQRLRQRLHAVRPPADGTDFERAVMLSRSGRFRALDYFSALRETAEARGAGTATVLH
jgi:hypothetical protein